MATPPEKPSDAPEKPTGKGPKKADRNPSGPTGWYVLAAVVLAVVVISVLPGRQAEVMAITGFKDGLEDGRYGPETISELTLDRTSLSFKYKSGPTAKEPEPKTTRYRVDLIGQTEDKRTALLESIEQAGISYKSAADQSQWQALLYLVVMPGVLLLLFILLLRRIGGAGAAMNFGRSRGKLAALEDVGITFTDVAGIDEAVEELKEIVEFLRTPEKYQALGGRIPRGVLLVGPPGTGKTLLAKAVAGEAGVPFYSLSGSDFVEMFVGVGAARVRDMFQQAQAKAPSIIFIDELDALGKTRGSGMPGGHDEREQTLNALLVEMDGFDSDKSVIVIGATNRPETLDPALLRPGRFDRNVTVDRPDKSGRKKILDVHAKRVKLDEDVDLERVSRITPGFVGADLANLVNEAALLAARNDKSAASQAEFEEGIERVVAGLEKSGRLIREDEKERVSYHECGHALVACALPMTDPVHKISIIPRGMGLGYTLHFPEDERMLTSQTELFNRICCLLGGMAAERIVYDENCTGVQNDLQRASDIARRMVTEFGMSEKLGKSYYSETRTSFLGPQAVGESMHAEQTVREIDLEVRRIIDEAYDTADEILRTRREVLDRLARELLEAEVMDADQLQKIIEEYKAGTGPQLKPGTSTVAKTGDIESDTTAGTAGDSRGGIEIG